MMNKEAIINHCRQMDKSAVYEWIAEDEFKIKDLQQRIDKLQKELEQEVKYNLMFVSDDKGRNYYKNIIDKAIEYIKTTVVMSDGTKLKDITDGIELLEILGGKE